MIVKIGCVDLEDGRGNRTPFGRVNITLSSGKRKWHFFKSREEWNQFYTLWHVLEKPWKLNLDVQLGLHENKWSVIK